MSELGLAIRNDSENDPAGLALSDPTFLSDELPVLIAFIDEEQRYRHVNRAYESFFGCSRADIIGKTIRERTGPEHHAVAEPYIKRALLGQHPTFLSCIRHSDGTLREIEVSYTPHKDDGGKIVGFISFIQSLSERNVAAEARARLAAIVDSSDDAIVSKTLDGIITSWNRAAEKIFGYKASEAIGQHISLIIPPERRGEENEVLSRLRRGEKIDHFETECCAKDGRTVCVSLSVSPIRNATGELIGASKVARDITEQKRAAEALRSSEQYRQAIVECMPECVQVLDREGRVLQMNPAGLRMVQAESPDEVIGKCVYPLIDKEDLDNFRAVNQSVFEGGSGGHLEFVVHGLKGSVLIFETNVVPLQGGSGEVIGALSVTRDVTARRGAERRYAFLVHLDDETRSLSDPEQITSTAAKLLCQHLKADRCSYAEINLDEGNIDVAGSYSETLPSLVGRYASSGFGAGFLESMQTGVPYVFRDAKKELPSDAAAAYGAIDIAAIISIPLIKGGTLVAGMGVHQTVPRNWLEEEIELCRIVANRCWESIQRARAERELRESEEQFRTLSDAIPNLAWMAYADGSIFWYNKRWFEYTGTTQEEMEGWGWERVHDPEILPTVLERWKFSITSGEPFEMVFPLRGANGEFRQFLTRVEPLKNPEGKVLRWFGTNTDVTIQHEAELREKKARETAQVLNRVGPLLAAELDPQKLTQKITDIATEAVQAQFGAFFHSLVDERGESYVLYTLSGVPREAFANFPMPRNTHVFGPTFRGEGVVRSDDITKDARYGKNPPFSGMPAGHLPVRSYLAVPVTSRSGKVVGGLFFGHAQVGVFSEEAEAIVGGIAAQAAIALDNAALFEELRKSGEAIHRSNTELRRLNEDLNQFAYSASHDLREPLRMVSIYTQFLSRRLGEGLDEECQEFLEYILGGASRMEALVRDLLAFTQSGEEKGGQVLSADGNRALEKALENLSAVIHESGATITASKLPCLRVHEIELTQLLQNLIGNAIKYRRDVEVKVEVNAVLKGEVWEVSVADNGIGIAADYKEQIFGVFKRLHSSDDYPGTGIGLAICQRIVHRAGGRIWVDSEPGKGSTFFFTLYPGEAGRGEESCG
jgi:PAS domain S-box-containing protein